MNPALISAGVGLLSSVFGGKQSTPGYVKRNYDLQNSILHRGLDLYDNTDLEQLDNETVANYSTAAMDQAMKLLSNYDAKLAGSGASIFKGDTQKNRTRGQIAGDSTARIANLAAQLSSTRADRRAALLPSASAAQGGFQSAAYLDNQGMADANANQAGLMNAATLLAGLFNQKGAQSGTSGPVRNDMFGINFSNPASALGYNPKTYGRLGY